VIREVQCSISVKALVIFIDAMHNEESNRKKPKKVEGRSLRKWWCFAFAITPCGTSPPKDHANKKEACPSYFFGVSKSWEST